MTEADHRRVIEILTFATNLEHAGDVVERNLLGLAAKKAKRGLAFSAEVQAELLAVIDRLTADLRAAASLLVTGDSRAARILAVEKETFRGIEAQATAAHFERLRAGPLKATEVSSMHLDLLRDLKRIGSHLVAAAAYPVLESSGELLPSRLRQTGEIWTEANPSDDNGRLL
jgi:phosphate:Na+ symporter